MMKKIFGLISAFVLVLALASIGLAGTTITGEIVKIEGEMVSVKEDHTEKVQRIHVDSKTTKKTGELKEGAKVTVQVDDRGHAQSVEVVEVKG